MHRLISALRGCLLCMLACWALATHAESVPSAKAWEQLSPQEQNALAPLASRWSELTELQRGKWRQIARQFSRLSPADQAVLQERMSDWVALSAIERNRARLYFSTLQSLSSEEKRSKWDEYQALSEDRKKELSSNTLTPARTAAPSSKPQLSGTLVQPNLRILPEQSRQAVMEVDPHTLLPRKPALPTSPRSTSGTSSATAPAAAAGS